MMSLLLNKGEQLCCPIRKPLGATSFRKGCNMAKASEGIAVKGNRLQIDLPLGKGETSKSGKSTVLATTHGAVDAGGGVMVNLTVYRKNGKN